MPRRPVIPPSHTNQLPSPADASYRTYKELLDSVNAFAKRNGYEIIRYPYHTELPGHNTVQKLVCSRSVGKKPAKTGCRWTAYVKKYVRTKAPATSSPTTASSYLEQNKKKIAASSVKIAPAPPPEGSSTIATSPSPLSPVLNEAEKEIIWVFKCTFKLHNHGANNEHLESAQELEHSLGSTASTTVDKSGGATTESITSYSPSTRTKASYHPSPIHTHSPFPPTHPQQPQHPHQQHQHQGPHNEPLLLPQETPEPSYPNSPFAQYLPQQLQHYQQQQTPHLYPPSHPSNVPPYPVPGSRPEQHQQPFMQNVNFTPAMQVPENDQRRPSSTSIQELNISSAESIQSYPPIPSQPQDRQHFDLQRMQQQQQQDGNTSQPSPMEGSHNIVNLEPINFPIAPPTQTNILPMLDPRALLLNETLDSLPFNPNHSVPLPSAKNFGGIPQFPIRPSVSNTIGDIDPSSTEFSRGPTATTMEVTTHTATTTPATETTTTNPEDFMPTISATTENTMNVTTTNIGLSPSISPLRASGLGYPGNASSVIPNASLSAIFQRFSNVPSTDDMDILNANVAAFQVLQAQINPHATNSSMGPQTHPFPAYQSGDNSMDVLDLGFDPVMELMDQQHNPPPVSASDASASPALSLPLAPFADASAASPLNFGSFESSHYWGHLFLYMKGDGSLYDGLQTDESTLLQLQQQQQQQQQQQAGLSLSTIELTKPAMQMTAHNDQANPYPTQVPSQPQQEHLSEDNDKSDGDLRKEESNKASQSPHTNNKTAMALDETYPLPQQVTFTTV